MFGHFSFKSPIACWKRVSYIVCIFTITCFQLTYLQCVPRDVHRIWMSSFCVKDTVCFHVLVNDLVIRVPLTDTESIPCICTSGSATRGAMHWLVGRNSNNQDMCTWYLGCTVAPCDICVMIICTYDIVFMYNFNWSFYMLCNLSEMTNKIWTIISTAYRWIPLTKGQSYWNWCFLCCEPEQVWEQTVELPVICEPKF